MKNAKLFAAILFYSGSALAQNSVTLFGVVDNGFSYQNSATTLGSQSNGKSLVKMTSGAWNGSRFGMTGNEDLGAGTTLTFNLDAGVNTANGNLGYTNGLFTREAAVGVTNQNYGTVKLGRTYPAYYLMVYQYGPTTYLSGAFGAHPGDIDSLDTTYRTNNSVVYVSPNIHGLTFAGSYSFGGVPGSLDAGSSWGGGLLYSAGPFGIGAAFQRVNNSTPGGGVWGANSTTSSGGEPGVSAINYGYMGAQAQQRVAVDAHYVFSPQWDVSAAYTNVQYIPGVNSGFQDKAIFNTVGAVLHYQATGALSLATGYSYTRATQANGITNAASYQQVTLTEYYALSKRTALYAGQAYQRASGKTLVNGVPVEATASVGDGFNSAPSSTRNQFVVGAGLVTHF